MRILCTRLIPGETSSKQKSNVTVTHAQYTYNDPDLVTLPAPSEDANYKADELIVRVLAMTFPV